MKFIHPLEFCIADGMPLTNPDDDSDFDDHTHYLFHDNTECEYDSDSYNPILNQKSTNKTTNVRQLSKFIGKPTTSSYFGMKIW